MGLDLGDSRLSILLLPLTLSLYKLPRTRYALLHGLDVPIDAFHSVSCTAEEVSVMTSVALPSIIRDACIEVEAGWSMFRMKGPLDLSMTAVLHQFTSALKQVPLMAFATFDTDYIAVRSVRAQEARDALEKEGWRVEIL